jgi:autotransporter passenger strand-loop-strand repeat protein
VNAGGIEHVVAGGTASGATINGFEFAFGTTSGMTVNSGGLLDVFAGGVDSGATLNSGGRELVLSGGTASGAIISGGTLEVQSGGSTGAGAVVFASGVGGTLQLDDSIGFGSNGGLVAGFGDIDDFIDFRDIPFTSGVTTVSFAEALNNTSGTLTVTSGGLSANITLLGQYSTFNFKATDDGFGGTAVHDPPVGADQSIALVNNQNPRA